jgi:hypothetical protein
MISANTSFSEALSRLDLSYKLNYFSDNDYFRYLLDEFETERNHAKQDLKKDVIILKANVF